MANIYENNRNQEQFSIKTKKLLESKISNKLLFDKLVELLHKSNGNKQTPCDCYVQCIRNQNNNEQNQCDCKNKCIENQNNQQKNQCDFKNICRLTKIKCITDEIEKDKTQNPDVYKYVALTIPNWFKMDAERKYKHLQRMLERAEAVRKYEIDLQWSRSTFFYTFIAILLGGFGLLAGSDMSVAKDSLKLSPTHLLRFIASTGLILSFIWMLTCIESKRIFESWEIDVNYLEHLLDLSLYRVFFKTKPALSVSKANIFVATFTVWIWLFIIFYLISLIVYNNFIIPSNLLPNEDNLRFLKALFSISPLIIGGILGLIIVMKSSNNCCEVIRNYFKPLKCLLFINDNKIEENKNEDEYEYKNIISDEELLLFKLKEINLDKLKKL